MTPPDALPWLVALLLAVLAAILWLAWRWERGRASRRGARRQARARRAEDGAIGLLRSRGYRVEEVQPTGSWTVAVDGEVHAVEARVDLLVSRRGRRYVAEVKSGRRAPDPTHPATRRQLLEYLYVYRPHGLLLVDTEAGEVVEVAFPDAPAPPRRRRRR